MNRRAMWWVATWLTCQDSRPPAAGKATAVAAAASSVTGKVLWTGQPPADRMIMNPEPAFGVRQFPDERLLVGPAGELRNAVVSLVPLEGQDLGRLAPPQVPALDGEAPLPPCTMVLRKGLYLPRVLVMRAGETFTFRNEEPVVTNVRFHAQRNRGFNKAVSGAGKATSVKLDHAEALRVTSDVYGWIAANIVVLDHDAWRLTAADGRFRFDGVPPGRYRLEVWHEAASTSQEIELATGKAQQLELAVTDGKGPGSRPAGTTSRQPR